MILEGPLDLAATLRGGQAFRWREDGDGFVGTIGRRAVRLVPEGDGARWEATPAGGRTEVDAYFGDPADHRAALRRISRERALRPTISRFRGLRLLRQDPWEALVGFIVSANNNVPRIEGILGRIAAAAGEPVASPWGDVFAFPLPSSVARVPTARLRRLGLGYRAPYLAATARAVADGFDLHGLSKLDLEAAQSELQTLPGVGPKVADCVLAFALGHGEAFPVDRHVARAARALWAEAPEAPRELAAWARARWGADAAFLQQFVFHAERTRARPRATTPAP